MQSIYRSPSKRCPQLQHHRRFFVDGTGFKFVRDRGLDHVVEREKHLRPVINVKNLLKSEPSKSIPISVIAQQRDSLGIPFRPIDFIRRYPAIFEEFLPGGVGIHPHVKLKPEVLNLDAEENLVYQSDNYRKNVADRLLKLLMISRINKIPLRIVDTLKWDLGLPQDYVRSIVPEFPDYFRVIDGSNSTPVGLKPDLNLELVCWSSELAVSTIEKKEKGYEKGMPIVFPTHFSKGCEMDKKVKNWVDDWQRLPYISPYENACHLGPNTDESDRWVVAVMHEILNLFVAKLTERDDVLELGEWLGIRSRLKRALLYHPGIFYLSSKAGTYTVALREAFKRGLLIEKNPLVDIRNQYLHLMHSVKQDSKLVSMPGGSTRQEKKKTTHEESKATDKINDNDDDISMEQSEDDVTMEESDDDDRDDEFQDDDNDDGEGEASGEQNLKQRGAFRNDSFSRGRTNRKTKLGAHGSSRGLEIRRSDGKDHDKTKEKFSRRETSREQTIHGSSNDKSKFSDDEFEDDDNDDGEERQYLKQRGAFRNASSGRGRTNKKINLGVQGSSGGFEIQSSDSKCHVKPKEKISRRREISREHNLCRSSKGRRNDEFGDDGNDRKENGEQYLGQRGAFRNASSSRGRANRKINLDVQGSARGFGRQRSENKGHGKPKENFSRRRETNSKHNIRGSSRERSNSTDSRGCSLPIKNVST